MKICHLTSAHKSTDVRIFKKQCVSLANSGYNVYLVATGDSRIDCGVSVVGVGKQHKRLFRMLIDSYKVYKKAVKIDADIYQLHDPELLPYAIRIKRKGKIVIFDSHEDISATIKEKEYIPLIFRAFICKIYENYQNKVLSKIDAVISVTPHLVDQLKKVNDNTVMITNYPIINNDFSCNDSFERVFDLCFAGGISKQWSHNNIIKSMENIDTCNYVLCGSGDRDYIDELMQLSAWNKVDFKGVITHEKVKEIYNQSKIGVALLDYVLNAGGKLGTLGNTKLFEFMEAGIPVICTDFILWNEIIDKYKCGICVNPNNVMEIEDAISFLLDNPDEAFAMGKRGRDAIEKEFNWKLQENNLLLLYTSISNKK